MTIAFLVPYLAICEGVAVFHGVDDAIEPIKGWKNSILSVGVGAIATAVVSYACIACLFNSSLDDCSKFAKLATEDRTYLAFCIELFLFLIFQLFLMNQVCTQVVDGSGKNDLMPQIYNFL